MVCNNSKWAILKRDRIHVQIKENVSINQKLMKWFLYQESDNTTVDEIMYTMCSISAQQYTNYKKN